MWQRILWIKLPGNFSLEEPAEVSIPEPPERRVRILGGIRVGVMLLVHLPPPRRWALPTNGCSPGQQGASGKASEPCERVAVVGDVPVVVQCHPRDHNHVCPDEDCHVPPVSPAEEGAKRHRGHTAQTRQNQREERNPQAILHCQTLF